jgi:hypothetical protein
MIVSEETKVKGLRTIFAMTSELYDYLSEEDDALIEVASVRTQYRTLRQRLTNLDPEAASHLSDLPEKSWQTQEKDLAEVKVAIGQMVAYVETKVEAPAESPNVSIVAGTIVAFLTMLQSRGLGVRWAVSAAALSLVEVITNQTLEKLRLDTKGDFDTRLNRAANALKVEEIEIPALLSSGLYKVRSKVIHEGKEPTYEEMQTILQILNSLHENTK